MNTHHATPKQLIAIKEKITDAIVKELYGIGDGTFERELTIKTNYKEPLKEITFTVSGNVEITESRDRGDYYTPPAPDITHCTLYIDPITVENGGEYYKLDIDTNEIEKNATYEITKE